MLNQSRVFEEVLQNARLFAAAIVEQLRPGDDLISQRQAFEEFGRDFIKRNTAPKGSLRPLRTGAAPNSPLKYSRTEILAMQETERIMQRDVQAILNGYTHEDKGRTKTRARQVRG